MKKIYFFPLLLIFFTFFWNVVQAQQLKIVSGQLFISGTSYGTNDYQTYLAFNLTGRKLMPQKEYVFFGEQNYSVYQDHPVNPAGDYEFSVQMPYAPNGISINGEVFQPVWYSDSRWTIKSSVVTPIVTGTSPQFLTLQVPFKMQGVFALYGARSFNSKLSGFGIADLKFEKIGNKYYFREGRYSFFQNPASPVEK